MDNLLIAKEISADSILKSRKERLVKTGYRMPSGEMRSFEVKMTGEKGLSAAVERMVPKGGWESRAKGEIDWDRETIAKFGDGMVLSFEKGVDDEPVLYDKIFRTMPGAAFTSEIVPIVDLLGLQAAFTVVSGGQSVPLAEWKYGEDSVARFYTQGGGYQLTRDDVRWNKYFKAAQAAYEYGQAYNRSLNHAHFAPIFAYSYSGSGATAAVTNTNVTPFERVWLTLWNAAMNIPEQKDSVFGSRLRARIGICNRKTAHIYNTINNVGLWVRGSRYEPINLFDELLIYDGYSGTINGKTYEYAGPADGKIYAVEPKKKFVSVLKEPLTRLEQMGEIMRLEDMKYVYEFVLLHAEDVANGVHEISLPTVDVNTIASMVSVTVTNDESIPINVSNKCATPVATPAAGEVADNTDVTLASATAGATIFYTTNGSTPTIATGTVYSTAIAITAPVTIKAIAVKEGMMNSDMLSAAYTIAV